MANSISMAFRGGIMIVTMITIPLLAIFGKQLPEFIEAIYRGNTAFDRWETRPAQAAGTPTSNIGANQHAVQQQRGDLAPAPAFQPNAAANMNAPNVNSSSGFVSNIAAPNIAEPPPLASNAFQAAQPLQLTPSSSPAINNAHSNNLSQALPPSTLRDQLVSPASLNHSPPETADLTSAAFQSGQQRLRELGASYFKLETTGEATERYRAVCQVAAAAGSPVQSYTSLHTDPLAALNDVIAQVERSRGGVELQAQRGTMLR